MSARGLPYRDPAPLAQRIAERETRATQRPSMARALHATIDPTEIVRRLRAVDVAGWGTTIATTPALRKEREAHAAKVSAVVAAVHRPSGGSLLEAYERFREREEAAKALRDGYGAEFDREHRAMVKSRKRILKRAEMGEPARTAVLAGFRRYMKQGGRHGWEAWADRVVPS